MLTSTLCKRVPLSTAKRQTGDAAAHDERFVKANRAGDVAEPGQAQADFDAGAHRLANGVVDDVHIAEVGARDADVAQQSQRLLPQRQAHFDGLLADDDAHGLTA